MTNSTPTAPAPAIAPTTVGQLRSTLLHALDAHLPSGRDVAVVEFPFDANVGNHLMWLGIMRYLRSRGRRVVYVAHWDDHDRTALRRVIGNGPILTNGGVGMTGMWDKVTRLRRSILTDFPENPVAILPQTVLLQDDRERRALGDAIARHPAVTIFARDRESLRQAGEAYPTAQVVLSPDLAFALDPMHRGGAADHAVNWLARDDPEATGAGVPDGVHRFDWASAWVDAYPRAHRLLRLSRPLSWLRRRGVAALDRPLNAALRGLFEQASEAIVAGGNRIADEGRVFVTDRFHGHILAALRQQPTVLLPDRFGKNRAFYETWSRGLRGVHWADTPEEALLLARELAAEDPC